MDKNGALAAVHAAWKMQARLTVLKSILTENEEVKKLMMGIGIHVGDIIEGNIGSRDRVKYGVVGDTVNLAARIQDRSRDGTISCIFVSDDVHTDLGDDFRSASLGEMTFKGKKKPVVVWEISEPARAMTKPTTPATRPTTKPADAQMTWIAVWPVSPGSGAETGDLGAQYPTSGIGHASCWESWGNGSGSSSCLWRRWRVGRGPEEDVRSGEDAVVREPISAMLGNQHRVSNGAFIAAPTLTSPVYRFVWPRDGSKTGHQSPRGRLHARGEVVLRVPREAPPPRRQLRGELLRRRQPPALRLRPRRQRERSAGHASVGRRAAVAGLESSGRIARALGMTADAARWEARAKALRDTMAWPVAAAWLAMHELARGDRALAEAELASMTRQANATESRMLGEQFDESKKQWLSAMPLVWSEATYVRTALALYR